MLSKNDLIKDLPENNFVLICVSGVDEGENGGGHAAVDNRPGVGGAALTTSLCDQ